MFRPPVTLPPPPDEQFSALVRVTNAAGELVATINAKTRIRTNLTAEETRLAPPLWLSDPKKFHYQNPVMTRDKKAVPLPQGRREPRKARSWV